MAMPLEYNPLTKVVPSDPKRLPHVPVQVLYLIAESLPQPSQVFNLARVNKATWEYLQPALYECEVTYEARLIAHFGDGLTKKPSPPNVDSTDRTNGDDGDRGDTEKYKQAECSGNCAHGLVTALCEVCGQRIAIENKHFMTSIASASATGVFNGHWGKHFYESRGMTALHWACAQGNSALPVARKAIEAAKAHNPSYIDGRGLRKRRFRFEFEHGRTILGEIPPPLLTATAFGNLALCVVLVEAGCNVNLVQPRDITTLILRLSSSQGPLFRIHNSCVSSADNFESDLPTCQWEDSRLGSPTCKTAGHVALDFSHADILGYLLDSGLDPLMGKEPLIHQAARLCDLSAVRALLERYPEMAGHHWIGVIPLHFLCLSMRGDGKGNVSLENLRSVAAYLVQKGASLEADGRTRRNGPIVTPLQFALDFFTDIDSSKVHAPVALIMLGANWDRPLGSVHWPTSSILSHCIEQATTRAEDQAGRARPERLREHALAHAKVIKAIVSNTWGSLPDPAPTPGSGRPMQEFLGAFRRLANDSEKEKLKDKDTFAIEAVGRLLLSTGIRPGRGDIETWENSIARNVEGPRADEWAASPWRELVADLPSAAPVPTQ